MRETVRRAPNAEELRRALAGAAFAIGEAFRLTEDDALADDLWRNDAEVITALILFAAEGDLCGPHLTDQRGSLRAFIADHPDELAFAKHVVCYGMGLHLGVCKAPGGVGEGA